MYELLDDLALFQASSVLGGFSYQKLDVHRAVEMKRREIRQKGICLGGARSLLIRCLDSVVDILLVQNSKYLKFVIRLVPGFEAKRTYCVNDNIYVHCQPRYFMRSSEPRTSRGYPKM